jgi:hypothetical protein
MRKVPFVKQIWMLVRADLTPLRDDPHSARVGVVGADSKLVRQSGEALQARPQEETDAARMPRPL